MNSLSIVHHHLKNRKVLIDVTMDKTVVEDSSSWIADNGTLSVTVSESLLCEVVVDCVDFDANDVVVIIVVCLH